MEVRGRGPINPKERSRDKTYPLIIPDELRPCNQVMCRTIKVCDKRMVLKIEEAVLENLDVNDIAS